MSYIPRNAHGLVHRWKLPPTFHHFQRKDGNSLAGKPCEAGQTHASTHCTPKRDAQGKEKPSSPDTDIASQPASIDADISQAASDSAPDSAPALLHRRALKRARSIAANFAAALDKITDKPILRQVRQAYSFGKGVLNRVQGALKKRYGERMGKYILLGGYAASWGAFGAGIAVGVPLIIPSSLIHAFEAAFAETYLQATKGTRFEPSRKSEDGLGRTATGELSETEIRRLGRECVEEITRECRKWVLENRDGIEAAFSDEVQGKTGRPTVVKDVGQPATPSAGGSHSGEACKPGWTVTATGCTPARDAAGKIKPEAESVDTDIAAASAESSSDADETDWFADVEISPEPNDPSSESTAAVNDADVSVVSTSPLAPFTLYFESEPADNFVVLQRGKLDRDGESVDVFRWAATTDMKEFYEHGEWTEDKEQAKEDGNQYASEHHQEPFDIDTADIDTVDDTYQHIGDFTEYSDGDAWNYNVFLQLGQAEWNGETVDVFRWAAYGDGAGFFATGDWTTDKGDAWNDGQEYASAHHQEPPEEEDEEDEEGSFEDVAPATSTPDPSQLLDPERFGRSVLVEDTLSVPAHIADHARQSLSKISSKEKKAIVNYTDDGYDDLNKKMRKCPPQYECLDDEPYLKEKYEQIESALQQCDLFTHPVTTFRGLSLNKETADQLIAAAEECMKSGNEYQMPSITSISTSAQTLKTFAGGGSDGAIVFQIVARKGLYVDSISAHKGEKEIIQSAHTKYRVAGVAEAEYKFSKLYDSYNKKYRTVYLEEVP